MLDELIQGGWLKTPRIIEAFRKVKRVDFLPEGTKDLAELNEALPIGFGQTISQPLVVAFMLELLEPQEGEKILDVGSGSGWTSALLGEIVGEKGKVFAVELVPELKEFGKKNAAKYGFVDRGVVEFVCADGSKGYEKEAPYDKILASAAVYPHTKFGVGVRELPKAWKQQLKVGGRIVTPIENSIWLFVKKSEKKFQEKEYPGFAFVPLVEK
ncbi:MAG: hypothetical protein G01um101430_248 [Parcubacteria group bacterium Gr01-1014_30]|nr:MAG: hypothetical protein G01um101430_248 [Parcubacteria group bacterium Gr01-1014_30]